MTNKEKLNNYYELRDKMQRMTGLVDNFQLKYIQGNIKEHIVDPLLKDGFEEDDINFLMQTAIHAAVHNQPKVEYVEDYD